MTETAREPRLKKLWQVDIERTSTTYVLVLADTEQEARADAEEMADRVKQYREESSDVRGIHQATTRDTRSVVFGRGGIMGRCGDWWDNEGDYADLDAGRWERNTVETLNSKRGQKALREIEHSEQPGRRLRR